MNTQRVPHPTLTHEYWDRLAKNERALAEQERASRFGSVESIRIRLANAAEYEARAAIIKATGSAA
jgi:hypothetical protein